MTWSMSVTWSRWQQVALVVREILDARVLWFQFDRKNNLQSIFPTPRRLKYTSVPHPHKL
jgi:hypothetical protein